MYIVVLVVIMIQDNGNFLMLIDWGKIVLVVEFFQIWVGWDFRNIIVDLII